jgi:hypothetical protein
MNTVETIRAAIFDEIDCAALIRRLTVYAFRVAREMPGVFDGISAE